MENGKVKIVSGARPGTVEIYVDGNEMPLSHVTALDIKIRPDELLSVNMEMIVDNLDVEGLSEYFVIDPVSSRSEEDESGE